MNFRYFRYDAIAAAIWVVCVIALSAAAQNQNSAASQSAPTPQTLLPWAYVVLVPAAPVKDDGTPKHVPGSPVAFTIEQTRDGFNVPDWYPDDHPPMPEIVAHGKKPAVRGCGYCHLPNGLGRPENSGVAGLPAAYITQQMADFKNGVRKSSPAMMAIAKNTAEAEVKAAAEYFSSLKPKRWIRVVESNTVPKTRVAGGMLAPVEAGGTEPIDERIIEVPENLERTELRDSASGFVAYVPVGSIRKGETLVTTGGAGKTLRCGICHGQDLKGLAIVPSIAGRSPSYLVRQLYDIQNGFRTGEWSQLMKDSVAQLTIDDIVSIAAYTASRAP